MKFFTSRIGYFLYNILQNRFVQNLISDEEFNKIQEINYQHNNFRNDYNHEDYQNGMSWLTFDKHQDYREWIKYIPNFNEKTKILEIGPGSGYYSRYLCENQNVTHYSFYEINLNFKEFMNEQLYQLQQKKKDFDFLSIENNFLETKIEFKYDFIFFFSSFHHIPNRKDYFNKCSKLLKIDGKIIFIEPTHYFFRIINIIKKTLTTYKNYKTSDIMKNCGTHAFLTSAEYNYLVKNISNRFSVENKFVVKSKKINSIIDYVKPLFLKKLISKYFSQQIITVCEKKN
jgi:SAM-dependent methyltransferase